MTTKSMTTLVSSAVGAGIVLAVLFAPLSGASNNGTLKVHEKNTPSNTENNDPKVCLFNFEGFGFDNGQSGQIAITTQGGGNNKTEVKRIAMPAANSNGYTQTEYLTLSNGHYKSTAYGKDTNGGYTLDLKAKSKVFKVDCPETTPGSGGNTQNNGGVISETAASTTRNGSVLSAQSSLPAEIPATGPSFMGLVSTVFASASAYAITFYRKQ